MKIINKIFAAEIKPDTVVMVELFVLLLIILYWPIASFQYIFYDDPTWTFENPVVLGGLSWKSLHGAITGVVNDTWCPLTNLSFLLESVFGIRATTSHLINFLLHLANVLLLFRFVQVLIGQDWRAVLVALLFAIHPMNVQTVAWVSERKGVLSTLFLLLMLIGYLKYVKAPTLKGYCQVLIFYVLSLASKPSVVTMPLVLLLLDVWPLARISLNRGNLTRVLLEKIPFLMLALGDTALEYRWQSTLGGIAPLSFAVNVQTTIIGLARYVANLICPIDLNVSYFHPGNFHKIPWPKSLVIMSVCLLVVISLIACFLWRRDKGFAVCWVMFLVSMAPVIQFFPAGHIYMADRYAYVPYIWLFIMIANALGLLIQGTASRATVAVTAILAVAFLTCVSVRQMATWKNTVTVFTRVLAIDPDNPMAHANVAVGYSLDKNHGQAIQHIETALKLDPMFVLYNRIAAEIYLRAGQPIRAAQYYQNAYDISQSSDNLSSFARLLATNPKVRNPEKALKLAHQAMAINPSAENWDIFAAALAACGRFEAAAQIEGRVLSEGNSSPVYRQHLSQFQNRKMITVE